MWWGYPIEEECLECLRRKEAGENKRQRNFTNGVLWLVSVVYGVLLFLSILVLLSHLL